ncbi:hypothetical protein CGZ93_10190 [Enemella dayhoffiae]|uniref:Ferritin-like domain-containing protein n=1 Tax=Enemella dayhoffiae TaxID=2016507 RepID=A0A255H2U2_9ACTN|nr:ferritin-like domain-containing protein [Enemella dayhoffiae]OYO21656.1 hypothetical protein CGZ93_10190 [Enemella dayhoffiae]
MTDTHLADLERQAAQPPPEPDWRLGARLPIAIVRSIQRFQVGESGDGATLIASARAAGDPAYARAVELFVAEENEHGRLLAELLRAADQPLLARHWSDTIFVGLRHLLGLRLELLVLMVAEVVALEYYRLLRDGIDDPLTRQVAGRLLADERRHVPFHCARLRAGFGHWPAALRRTLWAGWAVLLTGAAAVVALDHGPAIRQLGSSRALFLRAVLADFRAVAPTALG